MPPTNVNSILLQRERDLPAENECSSGSRSPRSPSLNRAASDHMRTRRMTIESISELMFPAIRRSTSNASAATEGESLCYSADDSSFSLSTSSLMSKSFTSSSPPHTSHRRPSGHEMNLLPAAYDGEYDLDHHCGDSIGYHGQRMVSPETQLRFDWSDAEQQQQQPQSSSGGDRIEMLQNPVFQKKKPTPPFEATTTRKNGMDTNGIRTTKFLDANIFGSNRSLCSGFSSSSDENDTNVIKSNNYQHTIDSNNNSTRRSNHHGRNDGRIFPVYISGDDSDADYDALFASAMATAAAAADIDTDHSTKENKNTDISATRGGEFFPTLIEGKGDNYDVKTQKLKNGNINAITTPPPCEFVPFNIPFDDSRDSSGSRPSLGSGTLANSDNDEHLNEEEEKEQLEHQLVKNREGGLVLPPKLTRMHSSSSRSCTSELYSPASSLRSMRSQSQGSLYGGCISTEDDVNKSFSNDLRHTLESLLALAASDGIPPPPHHRHHSHFQHIQSAAVISSGGGQRWMSTPPPPSCPTSSRSCLSALDFDPMICPSTATSSACPSVVTSHAGDRRDVGKDDASLSSNSDDDFDYGNNMEFLGIGAGYVDTSKVDLSYEKENVLNTSEGAVIHSDTSAMDRRGRDTKSIMRTISGHGTKREKIGDNDSLVDTIVAAKQKLMLSRDTSSSSSPPDHPTENVSFDVDWNLGKNCESHNVNSQSPCTDLTRNVRNTQAIVSDNAKKVVSATVFQVDEIDWNKAPFPATAMDTSLNSDCEDNGSCYEVEGGASSTHQDNAYNIDFEAHDAIATFSSCALSLVDDGMTSSASPSTDGSFEAEWGYKTDAEKSMERERTRQDKKAPVSVPSNDCTQSKTCFMKDPARSPETAVSTSSTTVSDNERNASDPDDRTCEIGELNQTPIRSTNDVHREEEEDGTLLRPRAGSGEKVKDRWPSFSLSKMGSRLKLSPSVKDTPLGARSLPPMTSPPLRCAEVRSSNVEKKGSPNSLPPISSENRVLSEIDEQSNLQSQGSTPQLSLALEASKTGNPGLDPFEAKGSLASCDFVATFPFEVGECLSENFPDIPTTESGVDEYIRELIKNDAKNEWDATNALQIVQDKANAAPDPSAEATSPTKLSVPSCDKNMVQSSSVIQPPMPFAVLARLTSKVSNLPETDHEPYKDEAGDCTKLRSESSSTRKVTNAEKKRKVESDERSNKDISCAMGNQMEYSNVPNLHLDLANTAWSSLDRKLKLLAENPHLLLAALTATTAAPSPEMPSETKCVSTDMNKKPCTEHNSLHVDDGTGGSGYGATPLHTSCWSAPPTVAMQMLNLLPSLDTNVSSLCCSVDTDGNTALHLCAANTCLQHLSTTGTRMEVVDLSGSNSQHVQLNPAAASGEEFVEIDVLKALLRAEPKALVMQNKEGDTPLHLAVSTPLASAEAVKVLAQNRTTDNEGAQCLIQDCTGATPLHSAIANKASGEVLNYLLESAPRSAFLADKRGMLPLHYVAAFTHTPISVVKRILDINPNAITAQTIDGDTPLHIVIANNGDVPTSLTKQIVKLLLSSVFEKKNKGPDQAKTTRETSPLLIGNKEKLNPLHCCALFDAPSDLVKLLMKDEHGEKAARMTNTFGATPLHLAAAQPGVGGSIATAVALGTPNAAATQDRLRRTPLHVASQNVHSTSLFIQSLAQLNTEAASMTAQRGHLPLHMAAQAQTNEGVIRALLHANADAAKEKNKSMNTPLHDATKYKASVDVIQLLIDAYPEAVSIQNQHGNLPLHCATAHHASQDVVLLLLKKWPEACAIQNQNKDTPLHYAAAFAPSVHVIQALLNSCPESVSMINSAGHSPIDRAIANDAPKEVIELLRDVAVSLEADAETGSSNGGLLQSGSSDFMNDGWATFPSEESDDLVEI